MVISTNRGVRVRFVGDEFRCDGSNSDIDRGGAGDGAVCWVGSSYSLVYEEASEFETVPILRGEDRPSGDGLPVLPATDLIII